jgi:hypothetical protein
MCKIDEESVTTTAHPTPAADFDPSVKRKNSFSESDSRFGYLAVVSITGVGNGLKGGLEEWKDGQGKSMSMMLIPMFERMVLTVLLDE